MRFMSVLGASLLGSLLAILAVFFLFVIFILAVSAGSSSAPPVRSGSILIVDVSGDVPETVSGDPLAQSLLSEASFDLADFERAMSAAAGDRRIAGLWIRTGIITAPWATMQAMRRSVGTFRDSGKPVVASSSAFIMREKEYYLASAADSVFLDPSSLFELNGFVMEAPYLKGLLDKLHVRPIVVRAGSFKSAVEPFTRSDMSEADRLQRSELLQDVSDVFASDVAASRNLDREAINRRIERDAVLSAREAFEAGLVDSLMFDDQIRAYFASETGQDDSDKLKTAKLARYVHIARRPKGGSAEIAVVNAVGTMVPGAGSSMPDPLSGGAMLGSDSFIRTLRRVRKNRRVRALVVRINSPGGVASAADAMLRELEVTAGSIPVVISMGDVAASGGYWITTAASAIVAEPLTVTGSIGAFALLFDASGLFEDHLGITFDGVKTGPSADMFSGMRPMTESEIRLMEQYTDDIYGTFLSNVARSRDLSEEEVASLAGGRIWSGRAALEHGLVDELGGLERAIEIAAEKADVESGEYRVRTYPAPRSFLQQLTGRVDALMVRFGLHTPSTGATGPIIGMADQLAGIVRLHGRAQTLLPMKIDVN